MHTPTVAAYTRARLAQLGIDRVFGVPGDYAFSIDDAVEQCPDLAWVGSANELNAAYAADGYARLRGAAILTTTYGVGELSAINGVMGSKAHRLPVFHLVGMPSERIQRLGLVTHHNLGDTVYDRFQPLSAAACCVSAVLTPDNCVDELERVIRESLRQSMPAYVVISAVNGLMPVLGTPVQGKPLAEVVRQRSSPVELEAAVKGVVARLAAAAQPVALVAHVVARYGLRGLATDLVTRANIPFAVTPNDKATLAETLPQYLGLYAGEMSAPRPVRDVVESADLVLDIGGIVPTELNTGLWSDRLDPRRVVSINDDWVRIGDDVFVNVAIGDLLGELAKRVTPVAKPVAVPGTVSAAPADALLPLVGTGGDALSSASFYPRLQRRLRAGDTLVIETGTCMLHLNGMRLPEGVGAESQGLWGSIGWATPACLGVAIDIIEPAGFDVSDRNFRRAGMDYIERAAIRRHDSLATFDRWRRQAGHRLVLVETDGACPYTDFAFEPSDILLVGRESAGVTGEVVAMADASVLIPQMAGLRSINVAAAAAMVLGEAMRQTGGFAALLAQAAASLPQKTGTSDE